MCRRVHIARRGTAPEYRLAIGSWNQQRGEWQIVQLTMSYDDELVHPLELWLERRDEIPVQPAEWRLP